MLSLKHSRWWLCLGWLFVFIAVVGSLVPAGTPGLGLINDKVEHAGTYALLSVWFAGIYPRNRYWLIALALILMGICIEFLQGWMNLGRERDIHDVFANTTGVLLGMALAYRWLGDWAYRAENWIKSR